MTSPPHNPRRRYLNRACCTSFPSDLTSSQHVLEDVQSITASLPLKKAPTFHSPTIPPSHDYDPILNIPSLPKRSPTCPKALEDAVASGERRVAQFLGVVDRSLSGLERFSSDSQATLRADEIPVPRFMVDTHVIEPDDMEIDSLPEHTASASPYQTHRRSVPKHHASDSGIGSTITDSEDIKLREYSGMRHRIGTKPTGYPSTSNSTVVGKLGSGDAKAAAGTGLVRSGINGTTGSSHSRVMGNRHALSEYACKQIQQYIIIPIVKEEKLKEFHPLVCGIPQRVGRKEITCLRDLEKVLLWLAPVSGSFDKGKWSSVAYCFNRGVKKCSVSKTSFINFCETSIQCIHTTVGHLNEQDQRRPADRPYTNGYFLDLVEQVRQYAAMLAASRERTASGEALAEQDVTADERIGLEGGLTQTGRPAELVRIKDGQSISLRTGAVIKTEDSGTNLGGFQRTSSEDMDDDTLRVMGRRRKSAQAIARDTQRCSDCDKEFKRPCDLTKHEKTHSRPWKCSDSSCKYATYGWPTEKERDRHVNDKHSRTPSMYKCRFHPCPYESKRDSNCKQHMEKAHGWAYVRSKNNGKNKKSPTTKATPPTPKITTPGSCTLGTPSEYGEASTAFETSPYSVEQSADGSVFASESPAQSLMEEPLMGFDDTFSPFDPTLPWNQPHNGFSPAEPSNYTGSSHRPSWDSGMTNASAVPSSFETSMTPQDQDPLFGNSFDWSNMGADFDSFNIQLSMPAASPIEKLPFPAFSRNLSVSLEQPIDNQTPSLSPGAHGNAMLYSPYSQNDESIDDGFGDYTQVPAKPAHDFSLYDNDTKDPNPSVAGGDAMFQDLSSFSFPAGWSGRGTDLAQQFGMNDLMHIDDE